MHTHLTNQKLKSLSISALVFLTLSNTPPAAHAQAVSADVVHAPVPEPKESISTKIARALSAAPANIAKDATVADMDSHGRMTILRKGTNDFTCMPGDVDVSAMPPMCADKAAMQWNEDWREHKPKPTITVPGIEYMLAGATQRSDSNPYDKTSPPIKIGPHWMILWPFDPKTSGLPTTHKSTGAYIMFAGTPWAHVHIMGSP
jgi:hypothetical protein